MRNYIITEQEREIIRRYFEDGTRLEGFAVLRKRVFKGYPEILKDLILVAEFYAAMEDQAPPDSREQVRIFREWGIKHLKGREIACKCCNENSR